MKKIFIDTNLIVYANDRRDPQKQRKAVELIKELMGVGLGVISSQVLQEYANTALTKLHQNHTVVLRQISLLESFEVVLLKPVLIRRAIEIKSSYGISFWDSCIISAAEAAGCDSIYSEDLSSGQYYSGMKLINPFV
ncbi:MAG: PIN domain-containing protein [Candidatus Electrothrix sp. LOE2]|jgi:predicted nucleic acid-binding protein|nr:PIN domain-containing protein [Candidatus Electrothrix sp. LOE2]